MKSAFRWHLFTSVQFVFQWILIQSSQNPYISHPFSAKMVLVLQGDIWIFKVRVNWKFATVFTSILWHTSERNRILNEENRGHGLFFFCVIRYIYISVKWNYLHCDMRFVISPALHIYMYSLSLSLYILYSYMYIYSICCVTHTPYRNRILPDWTEHTVKAREEVDSMNNVIRFHLSHFTVSVRSLISTCVSMSAPFNQSSVEPDSCSAPRRVVKQAHISEVENRDSTTTTRHTATPLSEEKTYRQSTQETSRTCTDTQAHSMGCHRARRLCLSGSDSQSGFSGEVTGDMRPAQRFLQITTPWRRHVKCVWSSLWSIKTALKWSWNHDTQLFVGHSADTTNISDRRSRSVSHINSINQYLFRAENHIHSKKIWYKSCHC